jgi:hypothetical protein
VFIWPIGPGSAPLDVLDVGTGEVRRSLRKPEGSWLLAMSPKADVLLVGEYAKAMVALDARSGARLWTAPFINHAVGVDGMFLGADLVGNASLGRLFPELASTVVCGRYVYSPLFTRLTAVGLCCFTPADPASVSARWARAPVQQSDIR